MIKARCPAKHVVYLELLYLAACPLSSALLPASSRSLPWAFSGGICWQGTACMDFSAMEVSLLLWSKGIQAHWPQKRLETLSVSSSSSWWGTGCSLGADEVFLTFSFPAINFHSGVVVVMNTTFHFLFLLSIIGFCAIQRIDDLIFQRQWPLTALVLLSTIENVATEVCGDFYLQRFFQSKSINNNYFWSPLASLCPWAASCTWNMWKPDFKRSYYLHTH